MPSREQVAALVAQGLDYPEIGRRLGVPPGQAYLIATGTPADGGHPSDARPHPGAPEGVQRLADPPAENPAKGHVVHDWIARRVAADEQMRWAGTQARARAQAQDEGDGD